MDNKAGWIHAWSGGESAGDVHKAVADGAGLVRVLSNPRATSPYAGLWDSTWDMVAVYSLLARDLGKGSPWEPSWRRE
jgi:hypothetical protein